MKKIYILLFLSSIFVLGGCPRHDPYYDRIKKTFYDTSVVKSYEACRKKCDGLNMFVDYFSLNNQCTCTY